MSALDTEKLESLDRLTIEYLSLLEELAVSKQQLESVMHDGFYNLSQARVVLGQTAISPLSYSNIMVPTALVTCDAVDDTVSFDLELRHGTAIPETAPDDELEDQSAVFKRVPDNGQTYNPKIKSHAKKSSAASDPIRWFTALPPYSLRSARSNFHKSLPIVSHLATLQSRAEHCRKQIISLSTNQTVTTNSI